MVESALIPVPQGVPLEAIAFLGCGMQTGAGSILNALRAPAGSSVAVSGAGAVGLAAVMAARIAGATTIVAIDLHEDAARPGTEAPFEIGQFLARGWTFKTIMQGSSVPQEFIPRLVALWQQGKFPVEKLTQTYRLDQINQAFEDSESGAVVKPVIVF